MTQLRTPVAMLIFNRPEETARVFEAVRAQQPERLLVVGDGPRAGRPGEAELVARSRAVFDGIDWPCETSFEFAEANMGCGARVGSGLDWVFDTIPEAIVLEDDCLPSPDFFPFAEAMLARYRDDERVGMIAGTNYFSDPGRTASWFFTSYFAIWGWASWARAWKAYDPDMRGWPEMRSHGELAKIFPNRGLATYVREVFDAGHRHEIDTWDTQWFYACLSERRLSVVPRVNLVTNIGHEGTRPSGDDLSIPTLALDLSNAVEPAAVAADHGYEDRLYAEKLRAPFVPRMRDRALRTASRVKARVVR